LVNNDNECFLWEGESLRKYFLLQGLRFLVEVFLTPCETDMTHTRKEQEIPTKFWLVKLKGRDHLGDLGTDERQY
jgi:hypothetical protein